MAGARRIVLQLPAQPGHVKPEMVRAALEAWPPDLVEQAIGANQLARGMQQDPQQPPLSPGEVDRVWAVQVGVVRAGGC
jgi:hypothetical protein